MSARLDVVLNRSLEEIPVGQTDLSDDKAFCPGFAFVSATSVAGTLRGVRAAMEVVTFPTDFPSAGKTLVSDHRTSKGGGSGPSHASGTG